MTITATEKKILGMVRDSKDQKAVFHPGSKAAEAAGQDNHDLHTVIEAKGEPQDALVAKGLLERVETPEGRVRYKITQAGLDEVGTDKADSPETQTDLTGVPVSAQD